MRLLFVSLAAAFASFAQTFDVASIKLSPDRAGEARFVNFSETRGRISYSNITLKLMISLAYGINDNRISGVAGWMDSTPYDVTAVFPPETSKDQVHAMLRNLLVQRMGLATHQTAKDMKGYGLIAGRKGAKLKEAMPEKPGGTYTLTGRIVGPALSMKILAGMLERQIDRPVADNTGITGNFDIDLQWTPDNAAQDIAKPVLGVSIYAALGEQLGLELKPAIVPVEYLVIDRANPQPAE
jgi:uncharacterized protein (TIGR03435 family)